jgi:hypothetical protein
VDRTVEHRIWLWVEKHLLSSVMSPDFRQNYRRIWRKHEILCKAFGLTLFGEFGDQLPAIYQRTES